MVDIGAGVSAKSVRMPLVEPLSRQNSQTGSVESEKRNVEKVWLVAPCHGWCDDFEKEHLGEERHFRCE